MNIVESFSDFKIDREISALFENVEVKRVLYNEKNKNLTVYIDSPTIISFTANRKLAESLKIHLFGKSTSEVWIEEHFSLPGTFELSRIMSLYEDSVLEELEFTNPMHYHLLKSSKTDIDDEGNNITIHMEKSFISDRCAKDLCEWLEDMLLNRFDIKAHVKHVYENEGSSKKSVYKDGIAPYEIFDMTTMKKYELSPFDHDKGISVDFDGIDMEGDKDYIITDSSETDVIEGNSMQTEDNSDTFDTGKAGKKADGSEAANNKKDAYVASADNKSSDNNGSLGEKNVAGSKKTDSRFSNKYRKKSGDNSYTRKYGQQNNENSNVIYGRESCDGDIVKLSDIEDEAGEVIVCGCIIFQEKTEIKSGNYIIKLIITDYTDSIGVKFFIKPSGYEMIKEYIEEGKCIKVKGNAEIDKYDHELEIGSIKGIEPAPEIRAKVKRIDTGEKKRVELHLHTQFSDMDGVSSPKDLVKRAIDWGHKAVAITDHGVVQAFPVAMHALEGIAEKNEAAKDFKIIYGLEGYLVDDEKLLVENEKGQTLDDSYVIFDIETTGLNPYVHHIIEIGAVKVEKGIITDRFSEFINPLVSIPYEIEELTGIKDSMLKDAGLLEDVLPRFLEFCKGSVLVAHNAEFDVNFIRNKSVLLGIESEFTVCDTLTMARVLLNDLKTFKLNIVAKACNVILDNHHRAVNDAEATAGIFLRFREMLREKDVHTLKELNEFGKMTPDIVKKSNSYHIILLAANDTGRINMYRLVSESHINYFNKQPRIPKSLIRKYREGLIIGSACEAGELFRAMLRGVPESEIASIVDFYDYLEIQPTGNNEFMLRDSKYGIRDVDGLRDLNRNIVNYGEAYNKPVVATCDVHFLDPEDELYRRIIMAGKGFEDADQQAPLYLHTTDEMLEEFAYLGEEKAFEVVVTNPNAIADRIERISPVRPDKCPPVIENSDNDLRNICYEKAHSMYGETLPKIVEDRLERELNSIISNGYSVMYIIAQKLVWKSVEDGYLVGSRGSVGSSFAATMSGITEVNPLPAHYYCPKCHYSDFDSDIVKEYSDKSGFDMPDAYCPECGELMIKDGHNIPFETFLGFKGDKEPDIDLNFSGEYQSNAHKYTEVLFGEGHTFRAGTIGTLADKTAYGFVYNYFEERGIKKRRAEMERIAKGCTGVRRTTGQHPGGIVVLPHGEEIYSFTPIQKPANDMTVDTITTHFEYHSIDHNLLKLDILGHDDPTMIRALQDYTGINIFDVPLADEKVMSLFNSLDALGIRPDEIDGCDLGSLGIPEFGTDFAMGMLRDTLPSTFSELVRISGLSHGTDVWAGNAQDLIKSGECTLSTAICTRDDIMTYLIEAGVESSMSFKIMESVRKGKGLKPDMEEAMNASNIPEWYMNSCRKIQYMFPKAHAVAYVMMAVRIAWFKVYHPLAYYAAFFSIRAKTFDYEIMAMGKSNLEKHMKAIRSLDKPTSKDKEMIKDMKIVQEMYARGFKFEPIDLYKVKTDRFQIVDGKLMPALNTIEGMGGIAAEAIVREASKGKFFSIEDFKQRTKTGAKTIDKMRALGLFGELSESNQLSIMDFLNNI